MRSTGIRPDRPRKRTAEDVRDLKKLAQQVQLGLAFRDRDEALVEITRLRRLLQEDHAADCQALTADTPCNCGWLDAEVNSAEQLQRRVTELEDQVAELETPPAVKLAIRVLLNHVEPGWENCCEVVLAWLEDRLEIGS